MRSRVDSNFFYSENFTAVKQSLSRRRVKHLALFYYLKKISVQTRVQKGKMEDGNQDIGDEAEADICLSWESTRWDRWSTDVAVA